MIPRSTPPPSPSYVPPPQGYLVSPAPCPGPIPCPPHSADHTALCNYEPSALCPLPGRTPIHPAVSRPSTRCAWLQQAAPLFLYRYSPFCFFSFRHDGAFCSGRLLQLMISYHRVPVGVFIHHKCLGFSQNLKKFFPVIRGIKPCLQNRQILRHLFRPA